MVSHGSPHHPLPNINGKLNKPKILIDMNTISLDDKIETKNKLEKLNIYMVDAPVSGTGAQAKVKDIVVMSSGDKTIVDECDHIFQIWLLPSQTSSWICRYSALLAIESDHSLAGYSDQIRELALSDPAFLVRCKAKSIYDTL